MSTAPSPAPSYNRLQQIFCLNWLANAASGKKASTAELQALATEIVQKTLADPKVVGFIGQWDLVWGPVVFEAEHPDGSVYDGVADNTMFVAQRSSGGTTTYVVAIAGTNPVSWYGWFFEDFDVYKSVAWASVLDGNFSGERSDDKTTPRVSQGTATGLSALLQMSDGTKGTLLEFLGGITSAASSAGTEIAVTGHSLGGALSASLALYLADKQGVAGGWDANRRAVVSALPSAGATPGNAPFALHYDEVLGTRTNRIWNGIDIVPHAWELDMLNAAPHLYYPYIAPNALVLALVLLASEQSLGSGQNYLQLNHQTAPLVSQVNLATPTITPEEIAIDVLANFIANKLAKKLGWSPAVTKAVAKLIEAIIEAHLATAPIDQPHGAPVTGFHPFAALKAEIHKIEEDFAQTIAEIGDSKIVQSLLGVLSFLGQAGYQHVTAYAILMGITGFSAQMGAISEAAKAGGK